MLASWSVPPIEPPPVPIEPPPAPVDPLPADAPPSLPLMLEPAPAAPMLDPVESPEPVLTLDPSSTLESAPTPPLMLTAEESDVTVEAPPLAAEPPTPDRGGFNVFDSVGGQGAGIRRARAESDRGRAGRTPRTLAGIDQGRPRIRITTRPNDPGQSIAAGGTDRPRPRHVSLRRTRWTVGLPSSKHSLPDWVHRNRSAPAADGRQAGSAHGRPLQAGRPGSAGGTGRLSQPDPVARRGGLRCRNC